MPRSAPAPQRRKSSLMPFYVLIGLVALAGAGVLFSQMRGGGDEKTATAPVPVTLSDAELQRVPGISIGPPDAPITIFEFADYQCPACQWWATFMEPVIKERLVDTGRARYVYYDFPLGGDHVHAFLAARAGRCANEQGRFWPFHDLLYAQQSEWSFEKDPPTEKLIGYARQAGVPDAGAFEACVRSDKFAKEVSESRRLGEALGVGGTPTVFVNGQRLTSLPRSYAEFEQQLNQIVGATGGAAAPATPAGGAAAPAADSAQPSSVPPATPGAPTSRGAGQ